MTMYTTFDLLPPPPRHAFSTLPEQERGRLPDFFQQADPAEALRHWTRRLYYADMSEFWVHLWLCAGVTLVVQLTGAFTLFLPRLRAKTFWLMRSYRRPEGALWVPNSMLVYTMFGSLWSVLMISETSMQYRWFVCGNEPTTFWLFLLLGRLPILTASTLVTMSLSHSLSSRSSFSVNRKANISFEPVVFNTIIVVMPIIQAATIIVPTCIAHRNYIKSLRMYEAWQIEYTAQAEVSQDMLVGAQKCWYALYPTFRWASLTFLVWSAWNAVYFLCYIFLSGRLVCVLRAQLKLPPTRIHATQFNFQVAPPFASTTLHNIEAEAANFNSSEGSNVNTQGSPDPCPGSSLSPKNSKAQIVRRQAPRHDTHGQLQPLRDLINSIVLQMIGFGTEFSLYCFLTAYAGARLPGSIETSQIEKPWIICLKVPLLTAGYTALFAGSNFLLSIAKRRHDAEPDGTQLKSLGARRSAFKNSQHVGGANEAGHSGAEAKRDKGGRNMTTFFESETLDRHEVYRPALVMTTDSTQHRTQDLQPSIPEHGLGLSFGGHRRFSQVIIIAEDFENVESVGDSTPNESSNPSASPRSTRFALPPNSLSTSENSGSSSRIPSSPSSSFKSPSPPHRMRALSHNLRFSKPA